MLASYELMLGGLSDDPPLDSSTSVDGIGRAAREAVALGLHRHLPDALGLLLRSVPVAGTAAFAHFVLGASPHVITASAALAIGSPAVWQAVVKARSSRG